MTILLMNVFQPIIYVIVVEPSLNVLFTKDVIWTNVIHLKNFVFHPSGLLSIFCLPLFVFSTNSSNFSKYTSLKIMYLANLPGKATKFHSFLVS